jgi:hypothetical protein
MRILTPLQYVRKQRARRRQVRTVLHMLSASGVIRPSHVEPRYFEDSAHVDALYRHEAKRVSTAAIPQPSVPLHSPGLDWTTFRQIVLAIKPSRLQIEQ